MRRMLPLPIADKGWAADLHEFCRHPVTMKLKGACMAELRSRQAAIAEASINRPMDHELVREHGYAIAALTELHELLDFSKEPRDD